VTAVYTDYIAHEIKQNLKECCERPKLNHGYYATPLFPIVEKVGKVNYGESNYATGPMTKTLYVEDAFGTRYKISVEELKEVKGHGHITYAAANKLGWFGDGVHWDRDESIYKENDAEYVSWLKEAREKNFPKAQRSLNF
jgi:hypothetical protein